MPVIARFCGLVIKMYLLGKGHAPAHIHVLCQDSSAVIGIDSCALLEGNLPFQALRWALEWTQKYRSDLLHMWRTQEFYTLPPLE